MTQDTSDKAGYSLSLRLNLEQVHLKPGAPFLVEFIFHVNALGTAHGKIRAAWQGSNKPKFDQSRFALALPKC